MKALRTPDASFQHLDGYPFAPHYVTIPDLEGGSLRVHYVDEGPADAPAILLLHGNPTWSYSYRRVIPLLSRAGFRVVALDLIGLGRSDKPAAVEDYSYARHLTWLRSAVEALDLRGATLVGQDWGGIMALCLLGQDEFGGRFDRVMVSNTGLYKPGVASRESEEFAAAWFETTRTIETLPVGFVVASASLRGLSEAEIAGYEAPYPSEEFKVGVRAFAGLIPSLAHAEETRRKSLEAWEHLASWRKPFLVAFSDQDDWTASYAEPLRSHIPGAEAQPRVTLNGAKHFVQDDVPNAFASEVLAFIERSP